MALDLLANPEKTPFHEYRHDLESFGWVLIWCAFALCFGGVEVVWAKRYGEIKRWVEATDWTTIKDAKYIFAIDDPEDHLAYVTTAMQPLLKNWIAPVLTRMGETFLNKRLIKLKANPRSVQNDPDLERILSADTSYDLFTFANFMEILEPDEEDPANAVWKV